MEGWIKLYRQFLLWEWYKDIPTKTVFLHLLIKANNADSKWKGNTILRGQLFTSISHISEETGLTIKQVRIAISKLESTKEVAIKGANKGTMITICKYDTYQPLEKTKGQAKRQSKGNKQEEEEDIDNKLSIITWRDDFLVYKRECHSEFSRLRKDENFLKKLQYFNPNVNIQKTIDKAYETYWSTEDAWKYKKKQKVESINWEKTITNAISQSFNKVYYTRQELADI